MGTKAMGVVGTRACLPNLRGWGCDGLCMSRSAVLTDAHWELVEPLMPSCEGKRGNRFREHRQVLEGIVYRFRTGIAWRDLPAEFGPWQTVWKRHHRFSVDGTWDAILAELVAHADAVGELDWTVSVDSTINRAHQHGATLPRDTGGTVESQESAHRAA